ncbi:MAG: hypothetical protein J3Q66DRAFT_443484 [Benniella sp.]|nr:MAG: hypothetical protein J3Q66DRAFT_443484 [Benniella sp.]
MAKRVARVCAVETHLFVAAPTVATCKVYATRLSRYVYWDGVDPALLQQTIVYHARLKQRLILKTVWSLEVNLEFRIATVRRNCQKPWICTDIRADSGEPKTTLARHWKEISEAYPGHLCFHQLFKAQRENTLGAIAIVYENQSMTYSSLTSCQPPRTPPH